MSHVRRSALRRNLMGATALAATVIAAPSTAQIGPEVPAPAAALTNGRVEFVQVVPHAVGVAPTNLDRVDFVQAVPQVTDIGPRSIISGGRVELVRLTPQIVVRDDLNRNVTPPTGVLDTGITGIGQMIINNGDGGVGLCTGTLINPRMVLFAAHCVNTRAATAYGSNSGGTPIGFGFQADNLPGTRSFVLAGPNQNRTNTSLAFYNASQILYNQQSLALGPTQNFIQADIAIAALDTPAAAIPKWTLLFSPLASPASISTSAGTGYHVSIVGYGGNGNGTPGVIGSIDFRRRAAENILGALASFNDVNSFLFGPTTNRPQNLYWVDFDDPRRGTTGANRFDFNLFRDNALPREGSTAGGDSGGPLIIDQAFARPIVIGTLSGGTRYFGAQPFSAYGTGSFYQPLYLFWDYIVANNPYRYVANRAGDRNWNDPLNWITTLDPAYQVLGANGQPTNGVPTILGAGITGTTPKFGEVCFQQGATNECLNIGTQRERNNVPNAGSEQALPAEVKVAALQEGIDAEATRDGSEDVVSSNVGEATFADLEREEASEASGEVSRESFDYAEQAQEGSGQASADLISQIPTPVATLANGLPGATNFVPNNTDGVRTTGVAARYFDVNLSAAGTTTLDTSVTIDRLTVSGAQAGLNVASTGNLNSLIDITQFAGRTNVAGTLRTGGDFALMGGLLSGTGTVVTPFLTSVMGSIAPGGLGTIGTLTIQGNTILASGSQLLIDIGTGGASDRLVVAAGAGQPGAVNLGGRVVFTRAAASLPRFNDQFTFLTSAGARTGTFASASDLSAILFPVLTYGTNSVSARLDARSFTTVINPNSPVQASFARLLDLNRANYAQLSDLFGSLDLATPGDIQLTFEALAPRSVSTVSALGRIATESMSRFYRERISFAQKNDTAGQLTLVGNPLQFAAVQAGATGTNGQTMSDGVDAAPRTSSIGLPENFSGFIAGGLIDGRTRALPQLDSGREDLEGWYVAGGVESHLSDNVLVGVAGHYVDTENDAPSTQGTTGNLLQGTVYASFNTPGGLEATGHLSAGMFKNRSRSAVALPTLTSDFRNNESEFAFSAEASIGQRLPIDAPITFTPNAAIRYARINGDDRTESGAIAALTVEGSDYESIQGRLGLDVGGQADREGALSVKPRFTAHYVREFKDQPQTINVGFAATPSITVPFALGGVDRNWGEISGGFRVLGRGVMVDLSVDQTLFRKDLRYRTYRAALTVPF